jgi:hypothetical protein
MVQSILHFVIWFFLKYKQLKVILSYDNNIAMYKKLTPWQLQTHDYATPPGHFLLLISANYFQIKSD